MFFVFRILFRGRSNRTVGGAALVIAFFGIVSRVLGFVRDRVLAGTFGAGDTLDAYYAAFRIPDLLYGLLVAGALSAAFVPVFTELREKKDGEASSWRLAGGVFLSVVAALGIISFLAIVFAGPIMSLIVPGFSPEKRELSISLARIMLVGPIFLGMSAVFGSVLVSSRNFIVFSLAPVFYNVGILFGALVLSRFFGPSGLAMGVVVGTLLHAAIQYPSVRKSGFSLSFSDALLARKDIVRVVCLMIPRSIGIGINQLGLLVATVFASTLTSGTLAAFTLANNIQSVPLGLFGVAFSLAVFPVFSSFVARDDRKRFSEMLMKTARTILFFMIPVSAMIIALRAQIVRVILGTGEFDWEDTRLTFGILGALSVSLFAQGLIPLFARAFFSLQDTKTPLFLALASEAVHIAALFFFVERIGPFALAVSFSVASVVNMALLYIFLRKRIELWDDGEFFGAVLKIGIASGVSILAIQAVKFFFGLGDVKLDTFVEVLLQLLISGFFGLTAFVLAARMLGIEELERIRRFIVARFSREPQVLTESDDGSFRPNG